jgi:3-hydroxyacyl-CoA dehydrogenase
MLTRLVDDGRLGVKSGAGIADYPGTTGAELAHERDDRLRRILAARTTKE